MRTPISWSVLVIVALSSGCADTGMARFDDNVGSWQVQAVHEGSDERVPMHEFRVDIERTADPNVFDTDLAGINTHDVRTRSDGNRLAAACREGSRLCLSTALGCHRIDIATGLPDRERQDWCASVMRDENLIEAILRTPSRWERHRDTLTLHSDAANAWIDLRPRP